MHRRNLVFCRFRFIVSHHFASRYWNSVQKTTVFYGNKFLINHYYSINKNNDDFGGLFVNWYGGLRDAEKNRVDESTYSEAYLAQNKDVHDLSITPSVDFSPTKEIFLGSTDWVALRNKYFINSLISKNSIGGFLGGKTFPTASG